ncbi:gamma-crystallin S-1-like [Mobula birostris]|uniref:gamma-crystallin S-1-like n=1 Tax=Mobula birostris TaxID=1983395 RepID=UPI003B28CA01
MRADLGQKLAFPSEIATTNLWPDLVLWSNSCWRVFIIELTVPWEAYERKRPRYANLAVEAEEPGWNIIFYEDRNFQGRHYECSSDSADLSPYFSRCNSIRVESDWWVLYERPNYMGYQYVLSRGEYPEYQRWMGFNDCIKSCRSYPPYRGGTYRMRIYERPDFGGQMMEFMDDCSSVYDRFRYRDIHSCQVMDGYWIFYEHPNYRGRQYFLRPGGYRRYSDWGGCNSMIGSFRRMRDF